MSILSPIIEAKRRAHPHPAVVPRSIIEQTEAYTGPRGHLEMGGLLFGHVDERGRNTCVVGFFPKQSEEEPGYCKFDGKWSAIGASAVDVANESIEDSDDAIPKIRLIGWIHTHPDISIYLSDTDIKTYREMLAWTRDERFVAVVVDPLGRKDGVFLTPDKPHTSTSARGAVVLEGPLRERYLAFLLEMERIRGVVGGNELPFIISGDLLDEHVSRGHKDDVTTALKESVPFIKALARRNNKDIQGNEEGIREIKSELGSITGKMVEIGRRLTPVERSGFKIEDLAKDMEAMTDNLGRLEESINNLEAEYNRSIMNISQAMSELKRRQETNCEAMDKLEKILEKEAEGHDRLAANITDILAMVKGHKTDISVQKEASRKFIHFMHTSLSSKSVVKLTKKELEKAEWVEFHRRLKDPGIRMEEILDQHIGLIGTNTNGVAKGLMRIHHRKRKKGRSRDDLSRNIALVYGMLKRKLRVLRRKALELLEKAERMVNGR